MGGVRIEKAKQALICFIRSLPQESYFNVCSFGSSHKYLSKDSEKYSDKSMRIAIGEIESFGADMGGTEIARPLTEVLTAKPLKGYPRHVFLLTDG